MRFRLATKVRGSSRPDTVLRSRPAHLRVTVVVAVAPAAQPQRPPPNNHNTNRPLTPTSISVHAASPRRLRPDHNADRLRNSHRARQDDGPRGHDARASAKAGLLSRRGGCSGSATALQALVLAHESGIVTSGQQPRAEVGLGGEGRYEGREGGPGRSGPEHLLCWTRGGSWGHWAFSSDPATLPQVLQARGLVPAAVWLSDSLTCLTVNLGACSRALRLEA
jgi:hypothetical protein